MPTPLVPSDLLQIVLVTDPQIAPDGSAIFYRRATFDAASDEQWGAIHRVRPDGEDRPFTRGTTDRLPRVAPDGSALAYVSDRDDESRLFVLRLDGGEAIPLGEGYPKIVALAWSPDARRIAFVATAEHDPVTALGWHDPKSDARHFRGLPFKSDSDGLLDGTRKHLFVVDVAGGAARQITRGDFDVDDLPDAFENLVTEAGVLIELVVDERESDEQRKRTVRVQELLEQAVLASPIFATRSTSPGRGPNPSRCRCR